MKFRLKILLKQSKKASHTFFTLRRMFYLPVVLFIFISLLLLLHNFITSLLNVFIPSSTILLFSLLNVFIPSSMVFVDGKIYRINEEVEAPPHLFYIFFHPQIHRPPIDPTSTPHRSILHRPHIDPTSTLDSTFFFNTAW